MLHFRSLLKSYSALLLLSVSLLVVQHTMAQGLPGSEVQQRIDYLKKSLKNDQDGTRLWWYGWLAGYGGATIGQGAAYFASGETAAKQDMVLGAATCLAGFAGQFVSPFQPDRFIRKFEQMPEITAKDRISKLRQMEQFLSERSEMEINTRKWKAHILPTAVNLASGMITWVGFHRTVWDGVLNFGLNCVLTESQIWSQPNRAKRELKRYYENFGTTYLTEKPSHTIKCNFIVSSTSAGLKLVF